MRVSGVLLARRVGATWMIPLLGRSALQLTENQFANLRDRYDAPRSPMCVVASPGPSFTEAAGRGARQGAALRC
jgi:hypothetical protein